MDNIQYIGEHLLPGKIGHFFTILSMVAALFATISYLFSSLSKLPYNQFTWKRMARIGFGIHGISVLGIIVVLFMMIWNHYFEYHYVYSHSSSDLPVYYMISCFWEGQEGSFLLWTFWHVILGIITIATARKWETTVMTFICFTQVFLAAMLIGIYFFGYKIGSSPFILLRDFMPANPAFLNPEYLSGVEGSGLNPLLQNYWMVIHPPILFLGFASTIMPFAYVLSALWKNDFDKSWVYPTLRWSLFSACILGVGILMGGAWAYESLSFGGYWAWDPVENASLVPWITAICGFHTLLIYKHTDHALRSTCIFLLLTFVLILYSTFLTRSGILGDTSVHAFTDLGMSGQLLVFLFSFIFLSAYLLISRWIKIPHPKKEESTYSREFWMFIGSLLMFLLAMFISYDTSLPVINKIFGTDTAIVEPITHYNRYSIWFGIVVLLLSSIAQYLKYKMDKTNLLKMIFSVVLSLAISIGIAVYGNFPFIKDTNFINLFEVKFISPVFLLLFASVLAIVGNAAYIFQVLKGKIKVAGSAVGHIGFGLMLLGVLISSGKKEVISMNTLGIDYGEQFDLQQKMENVFLQKDRPIQMGAYWLTYFNKFTDRQDTYFEIKYEKKDKITDTPTESFVLNPYAQVNPQMGLISNPSTKHYWTKDIFTFISSVPDNTEKKGDETEVFKEETIAVGDTIVTQQALIILKSLNTSPVHPKYQPLPNDIAVGAVLDVKTLTTSYTAEPIYFIRNEFEQTIPDFVEELGTKIKFSKVLPKEGKVKLEVFEQVQKSDFVILKAIVFPGINILWLGCIVLTIGFIMSIFQRFSEGKRVLKTIAEKSSKNK